MEVISTIVIGFFMGLLAKFIMPGKDPSGFIITVLIGIVGAFVGTYIGQIMGWYAQGEPAGVGMTLVGALVLLYIYRLVAKRNLD